MKVIALGFLLKNFKDLSYRVEVGLQPMKIYNLKNIKAMVFKESLQLDPK
jgi:hypothetical protein